MDYMVSTDFGVDGLSRFHFRAQTNRQTNIYLTAYPTYVTVTTTLVVQVMQCVWYQV